MTPFMKTLRHFQYFLLAAFLLSACAKEYSFETPKDKAIGNWEFKQGTQEYAGNIDTAYIVETAGGTKQLVIAGNNLAGQERLRFNVYADDEIQQGNYLSDLMEVTMSYTAGGKVVYQAAQLTPSFKLTISSITNDIYTGTFSGPATDSTGNEIQITDGRFKFQLSKSTSPESQGILGVTAGVCEPATIQGEYVKDMDMTEANFVEVQVTVAKAGSWEITSNEVNGVQFSGSGNFSEPGVHTVNLLATGTPVEAGEFSYNLKYGNSQCSFSVEFANEIKSTYFPLRTNNNWIYKVGDEPTFNFTVTNVNKTIGTESYHQIAVVQNGTTPILDTLLVRKDKYSYYSFATHLLKDLPNEAVFFETPILKEDAAVGDTWQAKIMEYKENGQTKVVNTTYTVLQKNVQVTGAYEYPDVIKIKEEINGLPQGQIIQEVWYARDVGIIYTKYLKGETYATLWKYTF